MTPFKELRSLGLACLVKEMSREDRIGKRDEQGAPNGLQLRNVSFSLATNLVSGLLGHGYMSLDHAQHDADRLSNAVDTRGSWLLAWIFAVPRSHEQLRSLNVDHVQAILQKECCWGDIWELVIQ